MLPVGLALKMLRQALLLGVPVGLVLKMLRQALLLGFVGLAPPGERRIAEISLPLLVVQGFTKTSLSPVPSLSSAFWILFLSPFTKVSSTFFPS